MITIDVSEDARAAGRLTGEELLAAVDALRNDGFVVLNDVVDPAHLDLLHERMIADLDALQSRPDAPYNWNAGNLQQDPPPFPPYLFADILLNPFVISVTSAVLFEVVSRRLSRPYLAIRATLANTRLSYSSRRPPDRTISTGVSVVKVRSTESSSAIVPFRSRFSPTAIDGVSPNPM